MLEYRLAEAKDIDAVYGMVKSAVTEMESRHIFQWDDVYPAKEDFLADIEKQSLYVGTLCNDIAVLFTINKDCDAQYKNGSWQYPDCEYCVLHRLCVNPAYQNRGLAKQALRHIEKALCRRGIEAIRLDVFCGNPFALSLYRKSGYETVGIAKWRKGEFLLMEKHL